MTVLELYNEHRAYFYLDDDGGLRLRASPEVTKLVVEEVSKRVERMRGDALPSVEHSRFGQCCCCGEEIVWLSRDARVMLTASGMCFLCTAARRNAMRDRGILR